MAKQTVNELWETYERLSAEADEKYRAQKAFWEMPMFAAVREALEREGYSDYYWAWYSRLVDEWEPLAKATEAAQRAAKRAYRKWKAARTALESAA